MLSVEFLVSRNMYIFIVLLLRNKAMVIHQLNDLKQNRHFVLVRKNNSMPIEQMQIFRFGNALSFRSSQPYENVRQPILLGQMFDQSLGPSSVPGPGNGFQTATALARPQ